MGRQLSLQVTKVTFFIVLANIILIILICNWLCMLFAFRIYRKPNHAIDW